MNNCIFMLIWSKQPYAAQVSQSIKQKLRNFIRIGDKLQWCIEAVQAIVFTINWTIKYIQYLLILQCILSIWWSRCYGLKNCDFVSLVVPRAAAVFNADQVVFSVWTSIILRENVFLNWPLYCSNCMTVRQKLVLLCSALVEQYRNLAADILPSCRGSISTASWTRSCDQVLAA